MSAHTEEQRVFIVRRLAIFDSYTEIAAAFALRFPDTACKPPDIESVDPRRSQIDEKLNAIFNANRTRFLSDNAIAAPTSDKTVRLVELHNLYSLARDRMAVQLAAKILEQIAKETGTAGALAAPGVDDAPIGAIELTIRDPAPPPADAAAETNT
jgi:hypothetical protein